MEGAFYRKQKASGKHLKSKFVNKSDICVNFKLDSTDHEPDFGLLEPRIRRTRGEGIPGLRVERIGGRGVQDCPDPVCVGHGSQLLGPSQPPS